MTLGHGCKAREYSDFQVTELLFTNTGRPAIDRRQAMTIKFSTLRYAESSCYLAIGGPWWNMYDQVSNNTKKSARAVGELSTRMICKVLGSTLNAQDAPPR